MKTGADLQQTRHAAGQPRAATRRLCDAAENLQQGALARPVTPHDAERLASAHLKAHVLERPKLLDLVALDNLSAMEKIPRLSPEIAGLSRDDVAQRRVRLALGCLVTNQVAFRQILDGDNGIGH